MAEKELCIFCGKPLGFFSGSNYQIGSRSYPCCGDCYREMIGLTPLEACRRALSSGFVKEAEPIRAHIAFLEQVDEKRPKCLRCGTPMIFRETQTLDNSPRRQDGLFSGSFEVLPLYCPNCGKMELFWPEILAKDENMAWLYQQDVK